MTLGLTVLIDGTAPTVNAALSVELAPVGLVTVTEPAPSVAVEAIVMLAVSVVELTNVVEFTVIPVAANEAVAPLENPDPVSVTFRLAAPRSAPVGLTAVSDGNTTVIDALAEELNSW
jgi:hypothetical protein